MRDDYIKTEIVLERCNCGAEARVRYRIPCFWVECKKKCGMHTPYFPDGSFEQCDPVARDRAVNEWNRMVKNSK